MDCSKTNCDACKDDATALIAQGAKTKQFEFFHYSTPIVNIGALGVVPVSIPTFPDSYMVVKKLMAWTRNVVPPGANFNAFLYNGSTGRTLSNVPINCYNMFGFGHSLGAGLVDYGELLPNNLKDPIILPPSSNFIATLTDTSGAPNVLQLVLAGYKWYDMAKPPIISRGGARLSWFQQGLDVTLPAAGQMNSQIRIDNDADFLIRKIVGVAATTFSMQISDSSSKESWSDQPQHNWNTVGNASFPYWLPKPKLIKANSTISIAFQDLGAGGALQLVFEGAKIYR